MNHWDLFAPESNGICPMALVKSLGRKTPWFHQALQRSSVVTDPKNPQLVKLSSGVLPTVRVVNLNTPLGK